MSNLACSRAAPARVRASSVVAAAIASMAAFTAAIASSMLLASAAEGTIAIRRRTSRTSQTSGPEPKMASVCGRFVSCVILTLKTITTMSTLPSTQS